jgi:hypothetical protein
MMPSLFEDKIIGLFYYLKRILASLTVFLVASGPRCLPRRSKVKNKRKKREIKRHQENKNSLDIITLLLRDTNGKPLQG